MIEFSKKAFWIVIAVMAILSLAALVAGYVDALQTCQIDAANTELGGKTEGGNISCALDALGSKADSIAYVLTGLATLALVIYTLSLATGAEGTAKRQLRAYVSGTPNYLHSFTASGVATISSVIVNNGQTPAYNFTSRVVVDVCDHPLPPNHVFPISDRRSNPSVIAPHEQPPTVLTVSAARSFSVEERGQILANTKRIYVFGLLTYEDCFGQSHFTRFCRSVTGNPADLAEIMDGSRGEYSLGFEIANRHNEAD